MKELSVGQMEEISGGQLLDCALAGLYGLGAICGGILGGPAGLGVGWLLAGAGFTELLRC